MINIYARDSFIGNRFHKWSSKRQTLRVSSRVRGEEIKAALKEEAVLNPETTNPGDVNIYVKPVSLGVVGQGDYLDFLDGGHYEAGLKSRPDIKIIACTDYSKQVLSALYPNEIVLIPHHHINFERRHRDRSEVVNIGYIGSYSPKAERHYRWINAKLKEIGLEFNLETNFEYKGREDAVQTYLNSDIFIVQNWWIDDVNPHKIPTKIINAMSFGVPVIAHPRAGYREIEGRYLRASNLDELIDAIESLQNHKTLYKQMAEDGRKFAEKYHIENIIKLYKELK